MKFNTVIVLSICALFLFYKYVAQLFPSLIGADLMSLGCDGMKLALIASSYYYSYAVMQIFSGMIVDKFSIRIPMFLAVMTITLMIILFSHTDNFYMMCCSRALMGVGASFATLSYMKYAALHTSERSFGIMSSLLATATMLGAACSGAPIALLFHATGWHHGLDFIAAAGFLLAFAIFFLMGTSPHKNEHTVFNKNIRNLKTIILSHNNWLLLLYSGLTFSPIAVLGGLWGTPFLMTKYLIPASNASLAISIMFVGHAVGSPLWAIMSGYLKCRQKLMHFANTISFIVIMVIIYGNFSYMTSLFLFFILGFSVGCFMLSFEICRKLNSIYVMGLAVAFMNSGEALLGSFIEPCIGHALDILGAGNGFTLENYQMALCVLPCCFALSSAALLFINYKKSPLQLKNYVSV